ncbi:Wzz/FepE/Etk N-terminal domain-containing protein [Nocardioides dongkuii]|uniref:Wzz/FepE/Etk N-terminal domain-containing protein n=1 Tax=Nocardioides dongkuii TaxID=2760089 RepID=UPI0015FAFDCA|nr:Wzz/FepE/Etk N-terminal domain-containing protein [Nocardioides dongkuii]
MSPDHAPTRGPVSTFRAAQRHILVVTLLVVLGGLGGWLYAASLPTTWTSTARVLVNPVAGNPFVPSPTAVRQDEQISLETEAQVARSAEVLGVVAASDPSLTLQALERRVQVVVPPNTQVLEVTFTSGSAAEAQLVADAVAEAYLQNRTRRADEVTSSRVEEVSTQTMTVLTDLRAAAGAAQQGTTAERRFQSELATALRNQLVSLRAQRTALETQEASAGSVIGPAGPAQRPANLLAAGAPVGGALLGLVLGCLLAVLLERFRGVVRSPDEVEELGVPVLCAAPPRSRRPGVLARDDKDETERSVRRLRGALLALDPRPDAVAVVPAGPHDPGAPVAEALAESLALAGHRVVLVRPRAEQAAGDLVVQDGLAQLLLHERLNVLELLQPTAEPLLCVLPAGKQTHRSRELLTADRLRAVVTALAEAGNLVVVDCPEPGTPEGQAVLAATDLGLVVVSVGRTRRSVVEHLTATAPPSSAPLAAVLVDRTAAGRRTLIGEDAEADPAAPSAGVPNGVKRTVRHLRR